MAKILKKGDNTALGTKAAVVALGTETTGEKKYKMNEAVYEFYTLPGEKTPNTHRRVIFQAGQIVPESAIDRATS